MYDVVVVGAGPAGTAAALRTRQRRPGARILLLDAAAFPRDKTCGDGISPQVLDVYERLGVTGLATGYPPIPRLRIRSAAGTPADRPMRRPARVVPRAVFDARLVAAAQAGGVELRRHRVRHVDRRPDRVVVDGTYEARTLIAADGANGVAARAPGRPRRRPRTVVLAVRGYATGRGDPDALLIAMSPRLCPAYAWSFPLPAGRANVGFGVFTEQLSGGGKAELLRHLTETLGAQAIPDPETVRAHQLPLSTGRLSIPDGRVLPVGDAASLVNPITGEGIYYAALSGVLAADAAEHGSGAGAHYRGLLRQALGRHHRHTDVLSRFARSRWFVDAAVDAAAARPEVFHTIVELGLADGTATPAALARIVGAGLRRSEPRPAVL